jgi:hypothetical protein
VKLLSVAELALLAWVSLLMLSSCSSRRGNVMVYTGGKGEDVPEHTSWLACKSRLQ